jgi:hypothetical protein
VPPEGFDEIGDDTCLTARVRGLGLDIEVVRYAVQHGIVGQGAVRPSNTLKQDIRVEPPEVISNRSQNWVSGKGLTGRTGGRDVDHSVVWRGAARRRVCGEDSQVAAGTGGGDVPMAIRVRAPDRCRSFYLI